MKRRGELADRTRRRKGRRALVRRVLRDDGENARTKSSEGSSDDNARVWSRSVESDRAARLKKEGRVRAKSDSTRLSNESEAGSLTVAPIFS